MQITVSGKQVDLSDALRTRVAQQLDTIAGKYFDHALSDADRSAILQLASAALLPFKKGP